MLRLAVALVAALIVGLVMTAAAKVIAPKVGAVDKPNARKVHQKLMPRMGGLGIYCGFMVGALIYAGLDSRVLGLLLSTTIVFCVGLVDDIKGISPKVKLLGQLIAAIIFVAFGGYVKYLTNPFGGDLLFVEFLGIPITILWLVGISNAVNLIDGLDGLAGGVSAISAFTMAIVALMAGQNLTAALCLCLIAAIIGFLRYNFNPASIFMGDSGSLTLGFVLAALSIMGFAKGATVVALILPILILGIPIFDTFFAIVRRAKEHKPIFEADKGHLHHRLLMLGFSHRETVTIIYAVTLLMGFVAILITLLDSWISWVVLAVVIILLLFGAHRLGVITIGKANETAAEGEKTPEA